MRKKPVLTLPKHVHRIVSRGREYFYFQRARGTASEGDRSALPDDPTSIEFWFAYNALAGERPNHSSNFKELIAAYKASREFNSKSEVTQRDYTRYLKIIEDSWGALLVSSLRPRNVMTLRDEWSESPVAANHLISVLKTLINWGIPREFAESNPCLTVPKFSVKEEGARPWPEWAYGLIEKHAREDMRRAVWLARYTGQRQSDIVRMEKGDLEDGGINVTQRKTGKQLWIPIHQELDDEMDDWGVGPPWFFVQTPKREAYTPETFRAAWTRLMNDTPAGRIRREGYTFHGLRASSCEKLREAGCNDAEIESITGMTQKIIRRYLRFANQKELAKAAIIRLEDRTKQKR